MRKILTCKVSCGTLRESLNVLRAATQSDAPIGAVEWCETHVDFDLDTTNAWKGKMQVRPYQREILDASDNKDVREITVVGSPRIGKSMVWKGLLLKKVWEGGESAIVVYQNDEEGEKSNRDTLEPLMRANDRLAKWLQVHRSRTADSYHLGSSIVYFQGAGAQILNKSARLCIGDEVDYWLLPGVGQGNQVESRNIDNVAALKMRGQTFRDRLLYLSSTPTTPDGAIWRRYKASSGGEYHLRCLHCGHLLPCGQLAFAMPDKGYAGLQWLKTEDKTLIPDSIRYICPKCQHSHVFADAPAMVKQGKYVHSRPENTWHLGFRANAICCPEVFSWKDIAEAQEGAVDLQTRKYFRNYYLASAYSPGKEEQGRDAKTDVIEGHIRATPDGGRITSAFMAADVQGFGDGSGLYYVYVVRGFDEDGNSWLLKYGKAQNLAELAAVASDVYSGVRIVLGVLDSGGFNHDRTGCEPWIQQRANWYWYKGDTQSKVTQARGWGESETRPKLILANPAHYQTLLLDAIYGGDTGPQWAIQEGMDPEYISQIRAMKPSVRKVDGEQFDRWSANSDRHDYFDAEKMVFTALDVAKNKVPAASWPRKNMPLFMRRQILAELKRRQMMGR